MTDRSVENYFECNIILHSECMDRWSMKNTKILAIDDDLIICEIITKMLSREGCEVYSANSGLDGLQLLKDINPHLVLVDILMPSMDGMDVLKRIREISDVPTIMLSALNQTNVTIRAMELGADDYIKKPFEKIELITRIRSLLEPSFKTNFDLITQYYDDGHLSIELRENRVLVKNQPLRLAVTEYKFLEYLYLNSGNCCGYSEILQNVWGDFAVNRFQYLHVYLGRLRNKIEKDPNNPEYLIADPGNGYRFEKQKE